MAASLLDRAIYSYPDVERLVGVHSWSEMVAPHLLAEFRRAETASLAASERAE